MQICSVCGSRSNDTARECWNCASDLQDLSETAVALARLKANPRVGTIRLMPHGDCCPACREAEGEWPKDQVPALPIIGCSHPLGCRCFYEPEMLEIYP